MEGEEGNDTLDGGRGDDELKEMRIMIYLREREVTMNWWEMRVMTS